MWYNQVCSGEQRTGFHVKLHIFILIAVLTAGFGGTSATAATGLTVTSTDPTRITVDYALGELGLTHTALAGEAVTVVALEGALSRLAAGYPELPTVATSLHISAVGTPSVRVVSRQEREVVVAPVLPSLGHVSRNIDPASLIRAFGAVYTSGQVYPAQTVELGRPFLLGDRRGVNLRLNPVRWDAARGVLLITEAITVEVITTGTGGENTLPAEAPASSREFQELHAQVFPKLASVTDGSFQQKYVAPLARGRMLLISHDALAPALAPLRQWKARRGITTELVLMSETDGTAAGLRQLVANKYHESAGLTWLVLVGDKAQVPANVGTYDGSDADSPYAMILGDDLYPELFVSRISASNIKQVENQVAKFISYERDPDTGAAAAWYSRGTGVASDEGVPADYERADLLRSDLLSQDYDSVDRIYQGLGASTASISAAINEGRSLINYLGHGSGLSWDSVSYRTTDIAALSNGGRLPWIVDVSCYNGDIARDECFAEAWLRAGSVDAPAGAIGMIAASSLAPWTPPTVMQAEVVDLLTAGTRKTLGALYYSGLMKVLDEYSGVPVATQVMEQNIIFGDASLMVRTRVPEKFIVNAPNTIEAGGGQYTVSVSATGSGTVVISHLGEVLGVADFAGSSVVNVPVLADLALLNEVEISVTGWNMVPWLATAAVVTGATPVFDAVLPSQPVLHGNYPNPFNPSTQIVFELPAAQNVRLTVYDIRGREVNQLVAGSLDAGVHQIAWQGRDSQGQAAPSGIYLYRLETASGSQAGQMVLSK